MAKKFQDLGASLSDYLICVSPNTTMFTNGRMYEVEELEEKPVIMCDCGFYVTTSLSEFEFVTASSNAEVIEEVFTATDSVAPISVNKDALVGHKEEPPIKDSSVKKFLEDSVEYFRSREPPYSVVPQAA